MPLEKDIERIATALETIAEYYVVSQEPRFVNDSDDVTVTVPVGPAGAPITAESLITEMSTPAPGLKEPLHKETPTGASAPGASDEPHQGVDKHGRVWDARIDSSNGKKTGKGEWQARRNIAPATRAAVIAELAGETTAPETATAPVTQQPAVTDFTPPPATSVSTIVPTTHTELQHIAQGVLQALGPDVSAITELLARWHVPNLSSIPLAHYPQFHAELLDTLPQS